MSPRARRCGWSGCPGAGPAAAGHRGRRRRAGSPTCWPAGPDERLTLLDPPASLDGHAAPVPAQGPVLAGLPRRGWASGALLADDMGLGKTVQLLALEALTARARAAAADAARVPAVGARQLAARDRAVHPDLRVHVHHGAGQRRFTAAAATPTWSSPPTSWPPATSTCSAATAWDRVVLDEAQHVKNARHRHGARRPAAAGPAPGRADRHAGGEPAGRPVVHHGLPQPGPARRRPASSGPGTPCRSSAYGDEDAAARLRAASPARSCCAGSRPTRPSSPTCRRSSRRTSACNLTVEQATLYQAVVDDMFAKLREGRDGHRGARAWCWPR